MPRTYNAPTISFLKQFYDAIEDHEIFFVPLSLIVTRRAWVAIYCDGETYTFFPLNIWQN